MVVLVALALFSDGAKFGSYHEFKLASAGSRAMISFQKARVDLHPKSFIIFSLEIYMLA